MANTPIEQIIKNLLDYNSEIFGDRLHKLEKIKEKCIKGEKITDKENQERQESSRLLCLFLQSISAGLGLEWYEAQELFNIMRGIANLCDYIETKYIEQSY